MPSVYFGGSRSLPSSPLLPRVVRSVIVSGHCIHVGCAAGADQAVIKTVLSMREGPSSLVVHAVFDQSGAGAWSGSAVKAVKAASAAGAEVRWLAGGDLVVPLRARLIRRSRAALESCSSAVFFLASPSAAGSLAVAAAAVRLSLPVFAFLDSRPLPPRGCFGRWLPDDFHGFSCWSWQPGQEVLFQIKGGGE